MKTTKTRENLLKAKELLAIREEIKALQSREKELKEHFAALIDTDGDIKVATCIMISKHEQTRTTWDSDKLNNLLDNILKTDKNKYKKSSTYSFLKIKALDKRSEGVA